METTLEMKAEQIRYLVEYHVGIPIALRIEVDSAYYDFLVSETSSTAYRTVEVSKALLEESDIYMTALLVMNQ